MKKVIRRTFTTVIACMMAYLIFVTPVLAASYTFSKTAVRLNALSGGNSRESKVTLGSILVDDPSITKVELYCNVTSGIDPYTIYVKSPSDTVRSITGPTKSRTITITEFEGEGSSGI